MRTKLKPVTDSPTSETQRRAAIAAEQPQTIAVEFGPLSDHQQAFVDLHTLRAVGTDVPAMDTDGVVIEFWVREGDTVDTAYDDIRGWAIGNGLPIRRMIGA
jgi:hypothetical protein